MTDDGATRLSQLALLGEAVERLDGAAIVVWDEDRSYDAACALIGRTHEELLAGLPYMLSVCWQREPA